MTQTIVPDEDDVRDFVQDYSDIKRLTPSRANDLLEKIMAETQPEEPDADVSKREEELVDAIDRHVLRRAGIFKHEAEVGARLSLLCALSSHPQLIDGGELADRPGMLRLLMLPLRHGHLARRGCDLEGVPCRWTSRCRGHGQEVPQVSFLTLSWETRPLPSALSLHRHSGEHTFATSNIEIDGLDYLEKSTL